MYAVAATANSQRGLRAALALVVLVALTGSAQGLHILATEFGMVVLPSWALGALELVLLFAFTGAMCIIGDAGATPRRKTTAKSL